jgi:hypothetical protein
MYFFCPNAHSFCRKRLLKMSVAAANDWYHAERRVMPKRQRRSSRVQRRQPRCRLFESFGRNFFIIIIFLCNLYNEKESFLQ